MQKIAKNLPFAYLRTTLSASQLRHVWTNGKRIVKQQYLHMFSQYRDLRPISGGDWFTSFRHPSKFQRVLRVGFVTAPALLNRGQPNFAQCLAVSWDGTLYIHFQGLLPLTEFCMFRIKFASKSCVLLYWQHYCTALE